MSPAAFVRSPAAFVVSPAASVMSPVAFVVSPVGIGVSPAGIDVGRATRRRAAMADAVAVGKVVRMRSWSVLLMLAASCQASGEWVSCPVSDSRGERVAAECARYTLPLSSEQPGKRVDVQVRRFLDPTSRGQLWLLQGGPGGTGSSLIPLALQLRSWGLGLDLYLPDHRGTGESHWLGCPELVARGGLRGDADLPACLDELIDETGAELPGYTTTEAARDVVAMIEATRRPGDAVFVWGGSYGTYWGHRMLQLAPDLLDGLVLDGACVGPSCRLGGTDTTMDEKAHALFQRCAADAYCAKRLGPDPVARLDGLRAGIAGCAGLARPEDGVRRLLGAMAARAPSLLPALVHRMARCEARDVAAVQHFEATLATVGPYDGRFSPMLQNHIVLSELSDPLPAFDEARRFEDGLAVSHVLAPRWAQLAPLWPRYAHEPLADRYAETNRTAVLIRTGALDMLTPTALGDQAALGIRAPLLRRHVLSGSGHSLLLSSTCADRVFGGFLQDPRGTLDEDCLASEGGPDYRGTPEAAQRLFGVDDAWDG